MEWTAGLPTSTKPKGGNGKGVLKEALRPLSPEEVLFRKKMGFAVPLDMWFRGSFYRDNCPDYSSLWHFSDKNTEQRIVTGINSSAIGQRFA